MSFLGTAFYDWPTGGYGTTVVMNNYFQSHQFLELDTDEMKKKAYMKKPTEAMPVSGIDLERMRKAEAKKARKEQIKRNGGKR